MEREYGHHYACVHGPLRFLPAAHGGRTLRVAPTRIVAVGYMSERNRRYRLVRVIR
ncbi:MAG: hypothetical protein JO100_13825 [Pseudonocardia sp.]|jgi:hypothetical protein|nr:hypothetical protein [Pseudonocardia sp.]